MYFIAVLVLLFIWALIEQNLLMTTKYLIASTKLPRDFADTSFIVLSDLHNHSFGKNNKRMLTKINKLSPDFIIVSGDMINKDQPCVPSNAFSLLEKLAKKYKIYYALGNHEQYVELFDLKNKSLIKSLSDKQGENEKCHNKKSFVQNASAWDEYKKRLKNSGVIFLDNQSNTITKNQSKINITGVTVGHEFYEHGNTKPMPDKNIEGLLGKNEAETFQILIAHNPLYFKEYAKWGADLTISGHLHGGLVRLPVIGGLLSPQIRFFPKNNAGRYAISGKELIVSRGLGSHSVMFRLFNPPELVYVKLKK